MKKIKRKKAEDKKERKKTQKKLKRIFAFFKTFFFLNTEQEIVKMNKMREYVNE